MSFKTIAAGWKNVDKNGETYLKIKIEKDMKAGENIFLRKNKFKKEEKQPDYTYVVKVDEEMTAEKAEEILDAIPF